MLLYRITFENDRRTKRITPKLPTLNNTADYGQTPEATLASLQAQGFVRDANEALPPCEHTEASSVYMSLP